MAAASTEKAKKQNNCYSRKNNSTSEQQIPKCIKYSSCEQLKTSKISRTQYICMVARYSVTVGHWTYNEKVMGSTPGRVAIKWSLFGWVTVCGQVTRLGI